MCSSDLRRLCRATNRLDFAFNGLLWFQLAPTRARHRDHPDVFPRSPSAFPQEASIYLRARFILSWVE